MKIITLFKGLGYNKKERDCHLESLNIFMSNLKRLSKSYFPYDDPKMFREFSKYHSLDEVAFYVPTNVCRNRTAILRKTGLKTIRLAFEAGGSIHWIASLAEYESIFQSDTAIKYKSTSSMLSSIFETLKQNSSEYVDFIERYSKTVENISSIVDKYGIQFIMKNEKLDASLTDLVMSFISEYSNYGYSLEKYKENEVLRLIELEQTFVDISIENSLYALEFKEDFSPNP